MKRSLANLEKEESAIVAAFKEGAKHGFSMRQHLNNIRKHRLYEACECENFEGYLKLQRLPISLRRAQELAINGEVEGHIEKRDVSRFSDKALTVLSKIRVTDETGKRTHDLDVPKLRRVIKKCVSMQDGEPITGPLVKQVIEKVLGVKPPKPFGEQLEREIKRCIKWRVSLDSLPSDTFLDAEDEYAGVVKRLAKQYSELASLLRRVVR